MSNTRTACLAALFSACQLVHVHQAAAQGGSILQATLAETGARTPEISTEQLRQILHANSAVIIDTRSRAEFEAGHIPGAVVLDTASGKQVAAVDRLTDRDLTRPMILYCNGPFCQASRRLGDELADAGYTNVRRYQLGIPVWRALGGPTAIELGGIVRLAAADRLSVFIDARPANAFAAGSLPGARNAPAEDVLSGRLKKIDLPEDDFNRRIVLFGSDGAEARKLADYMAKRPWHNVMYYPGRYADLWRSLEMK